MNGVPKNTNGIAGHTACRIFTRSPIAGNHIGLHFLKWTATKKWRWQTLTRSQKQIDPLRKRLVRLVPDPPLTQGAAWHARPLRHPPVIVDLTQKP